MLIACDVDLTVVDTLTPWMNEFKLVTGGRVVKNEDKNYSLEPEMNNILSELDITNYDPMSYWDHKDLYDHVRPLPMSEHALFELHKQGHSIVFVSSCISGHIDSKKKWLDYEFPYHAGFIDTSDKHWVNYDVLIDDRVKHMELGHRHRPNSTHIMFTGVREDGTREQNKDFIKAATWSDVLHILN